MEWYLPVGFQAAAIKSKKYIELTFLIYSGCLTHSSFGSGSYFTITVHIQWMHIITRNTVYSELIITQTILHMQSQEKKNFTKLFFLIKINFLWRGHLPRTDTLERKHTKKYS